MTASTERIPATGPTISVARLTILFAVAYAAVVLVVGVLPVNLMLAQFVEGGARVLWTHSVLRLALQTFIAWIACYGTLRATGRTGGRLQGRGLLVIGSLLSGALAGAVEVALRPRMLHALHIARASSPFAAEALAALLTVVSVAIVVLLVVVRSTRIVRN